MSFKRSIQREKKTAFTHSQEPKKDEFKDNFTFQWIHFNLNSFITLALIFIFSQFVCVPFFANIWGYAVSLVVVHAMITSSLVVLAFALLNKEKLSLKGMWNRFCFSVLIFGGFTLAVSLFMK